MSYMDKEEVIRRQKLNELLQAHITKRERRNSAVSRKLSNQHIETKAKPVRIVELGKETFVEMDNGAVFNCSIYSKHGQLYLQILDGGRAKQTLSVSIEMVQELYNEKI